MTSCSDVFDAEAEWKAVESAMNELARALDEKDVEALHNEVHTDWTSYETWGEAQYTLTHDSITSEWPQIKWDVHDHEILVTPDLAVLIGYATVQTGSSPEDEVYYTAVFIKEDGRWLYRHGHVSYIR